MQIGKTALVGVAAVTLAAVMVAAIAGQGFSWWVFPFALLFSTIFGGVLIWSLQSLRAEAFRRDAKRASPDAPWMWERQWQSDVMVSKTRAELWAALALLVVVGVFAFTGVALLVRELPAGNLWSLLNVVPVLAVAYLAVKLRAAVKAWRFERGVTVRREVWPARTGAVFSAVLTAKPDGAWLEHIAQERREDSEGVSFEDVVAHNLPAELKDLGGGKTRLSVEIPDGFPGTAWEARDRWWDLVIAFEGGVTLRYEVPVAAPAR